MTDRSIDPAVPIFPKTESGKDIGETMSLLDLLHNEPYDEKKSGSEGGTRGSKRYHRMSEVFFLFQKSQKIWVIQQKIDKLGGQ